jgi:hypothetical protein
MEDFKREEIGQFINGEHHGDLGLIEFSNGKQDYFGSWENGKLIKRVVIKGLRYNDLYRNCEVLEELSKDEYHSKKVAFKLSVEHTLSQPISDS